MHGRDNTSELPRPCLTRHCHVTATPSLPRHHTGELRALLESAAGEQAEQLAALGAELAQALGAAEEHAASECEARARLREPLWPHMVALRQL